MTLMTLKQTAIAQHFPFEIHHCNALCPIDNYLVFDIMMTTLTISCYLFKVPHGIGTIYYFTNDKFNRYHLSKISPTRQINRNWLINKRTDSFQTSLKLQLQCKQLHFRLYFISSRDHELLQVQRHSFLIWVKLR